MSMLSDRSIKAERGVVGGLKIEPWDEASLQPASYDLHLGSKLLLPVDRTPWSIDPWFDDQSKFWTEFGFGWEAKGGYWLQPGQFVLAETVERVEVPPYLQGRLEGKSSLGRSGLFVHVTAGFIDPGFKGKITLELLNVGKNQLLLRAGKAISQISFQLLTTLPDKAYSGKYQEAKGVEAARAEVIRRLPVQL